MKPSRAALCLMSATWLLATASFASAQDPKPAPMRKAKELIKKQEPARIKSLADAINPDNSHVLVSLGKQRAYLWWETRSTSTLPSPAANASG